LDAVDRLTMKLQFGRYNVVVEADLKGFFDNIEHGWLMRMLAERIEDGAFLRLIRKWLKAGVLDTDGQVLHPATGTPQGGLSRPSLRMCTCTMRLTCGFTKWSSHDVAARCA
jgi:RNA-directed DNA polymerase